jgi:hypothetical protein
MDCRFSAGKWRAGRLPRHRHTVQIQPQREKYNYQYI